MGQQEFDDAAKRVQKLPKAPPPQDLLELYSLFKQATVGDVSGKRPGMIDFTGRAKYDAWSEKKGMAKDAAMDAYVAKVDKLANQVR